MHIIILSLASPSTIRCFLCTLSIYFSLFFSFVPLVRTISLHLLYSGQSLSTCAQHIPLLFFFSFSPLLNCIMSTTLLSIFDFFHSHSLQAFLNTLFPVRRGHILSLFFTMPVHIHFYYLTVDNYITYRSFFFPVFFYIYG